MSVQRAPSPRRQELKKKHAPGFPVAGSITSTVSHRESSTKHDLYSPSDIGQPQSSRRTPDPSPSPTRNATLYHAVTKCVPRSQVGNNENERSDRRAPR